MAVTLVVCGAAALACARRVFFAKGGDPGGAYARVSSVASDGRVSRQSSLQENLLDDDYKEEQESPTATIRKRNLEMVNRGDDSDVGQFV